jgi:dimethylamine monooxygenase subunit C
MADLASTSIPSWAVPDAHPALRRAGAGIRLSVGSATFSGDNLDDAIAWLSAAIASAHSGERVQVTATAGDCLRLRGTAAAAGVMDDEIDIAPTGHGAIGVQCVHCDRVTTARTAIEQVIACEGCGRSLLVYYHVSRRTGLFMGYQADAEGPAG